MRYLLDTNILSEPLKKYPNKSVLKKIEKHQHEIATAAPVWHELMYGCLRLPASKKKEIIQTYLVEVLSPGMEVLPYEDRAAEWHAKERARLSALGKTPSFVDGQIASIARVNGLMLVTRNLNDFNFFSTIKIKNWFK